jgi:Carboxypeptidase regulatory-like domain
MLVLALTVPLFAQEQSTSAIWRGVVKNSVETPIVGAKVRLKGTSTAESTTAADGNFSLAAVPAGKYKLTIAADGTTATYAQTITLTSDSPAVVITVSNSREITVATQQQTDQKGGVRDGWSGHQRSGNGREHIHEFQRGCDSGSAIKFGLDAGRDGTGCRGFHKHRDPVGSEWVSRIILRVHKKLRS